MRNKNQLGCFTWPAILATVITFFVITGAVLNAGQGLFSPGQLNAQPGAPLGNVSAHAKISDCEQCHVAPWDADSMQDRCLRCHADIWLEFSDPHKLHGILLNHQAVLVCGACHIEHRGPGAALTDVTLNNFPHELLGFATTSHKKIPDGSPFSCQTCHVNGYKAFEASDCADCHIRLNRPFMVVHLSQYATDCRACHDGKESIDKHFEHVQTAFSPVGVHTELACAKCHGGAHLLADFKTLPAKCADCHLKDNPHGENLGAACESCHNQLSWKGAHFDHAVTGFALVGQHEKVVCEKCHTIPDQFKNAPIICFGCHQKDDKHNGSEGTACETCHTVSDWKLSTFNHNSAIFKLTGAHINVDCSKCHTIPDMFTGAPFDCVACHLKDDAHNGSLGAGCSTCHSTTAWKPSTFDHNSTAFRLTGLHASVQCVQCHMNGAFKGTPTTCFGCHQKDDKHAGSEGNVCKNCHTTAGWKFSVFNHSAVFTLTGAHANLVCAKCHTSPFIFNRTPTTCFGCHQNQDVHAGTEGTSCENCHTNSSWKPSIFNHNNSAFLLTGAHVNTICAKCHTTPNMFKGTPQDCYSCHAIDDHHAGAFGTSCGSCHSPTAWKPSTFDHNLSTFPLTGAHQNQLCNACHIGGVFKGTPLTCVSCHNEPAYHAGLFGTNCATCHSTSNWNGTYTGPHNFPMQHGNSNGTCATCHSSTLTQWTCYNCHNQAQTATKHAEKGITDISNCVQCHPTGTKP
jgi:hypothetical protein